MGCWETAVWCQTAKGLDGEEEAWVKVKVGWNPHESSHKDVFIHYNDARHNVMHL